MPRGEKYAIAYGMTIFDCRQIPLSFIEDTGEAYRDELVQVEGIINLPMPGMFLSFEDDINIMTSVVSRSTMKVMCDVDSVEIYKADDFLIDESTFPHGMEEEFLESSAGFFTNWREEADDCFGFVKSDNFFNSYNDKYSETLAIRLLGILSLLKDKLIATDILPDPHIKETMRRIRRGLPPTSSLSRVLTVNVSAVRRATKKIASSSHESPCLHWRRGHWRVNFRGSEFETSRWINKCLVGDPDKGFVKKSYRLVNYQPMLEQNATSM